MQDRSTFALSLLLGAALINAACSWNESHSGGEGGALGPEQVRPPVVDAVEPPAALGSDPPSFDLDALRWRARNAFRQAEGAWHAGSAIHLARVATDGLEVTVRDDQHDTLSETARFASAPLTIGGRMVDEPTANWQRTAAGNVYRRLAPGIREELENLDHGVEQRWRFTERPVQAGDIVVRVAVEGMTFAGATENGLHFGPAGGPARLRYGHATWIDAAGERHVLRARWEGDSIELRVAAAVVAASEFPAVLDPVISPELGIDREIEVPALEVQTHSAVAASSAHWLVVWRDERAPVPFSLFGARVASDGTVLDPVGLALLSDAVGTEIEVASDGTDFLVVFDDRALRVAADGSVLDDPPLSLAATAGSPTVAFDGTNYFVAYRDSSSATGNIRGTRVTTSGSVLDPGGILLAAGSHEQPHLVAGTGQMLLTLRQSSTVSALRIDSTGTALDASPRAITSTGGLWDVAASGSSYLLAHNDASDIRWFRVSATNTGIGSGTVPSAGASLGRVAVAWDGSTYKVGFATGGPGNAVTVQRFGVPELTGSATATQTLLSIPTSNGATDVKDGAPLAGDVLWVKEVDARRPHGVDVVGILDPAGGSIPTEHIEVSTSAPSNSVAAVSFDGTHYNLVWRRARFGAWDYVAARLRRDGAWADPFGFQLHEVLAPLGSFPTHTVRAPRVATAGSTSLAAWTHDVGGDRLQAVRFDDTGTVLDGTAITLDSELPPEHCVASDGTGFLVAYRLPGVIYGIGVSASGVVGSRVTLATGATGGPDCTYDGIRYVVAYHINSGVSGDMRAVRVDPATGTAGAPIDLGWNGALEVAVSASTSGWLVASSGGVARLFDRTGTPTSSIFTIATGANPPALTYDGDRYFAIYSRDDASRVGDFGSLHGAFIDPSDGSVTPELTIVPEAQRLERGYTAAGGADQMVASYARFASGDFMADRTFARLIARNPDGDACSVGVDCLSGFCVDGVCCESACGGGATDDCLACSAAAGSTTDGACRPVAAGTVCRASTGRCDPAEACDGSASACPADALSDSATVCRPSGGPCDPAETCTGSSATCPSDVLEPSTTVCRPASGACDVAESCSGASAACPSDGFASSATVCRASAGPCDAAESCTGTAAACPADLFASSSAVCRASAGPCDVAETCTGTGAACPGDAFAASSTVCRSATGVCDVAETCTGSAASCPGDSFAPSTTVCRSSAGVCDVAETCTGSSASCPGDAFESSTTVCRSSAGPCDVAEACTGSSASCPTDAFEPVSTVCRTAGGPCDVAETCSGSAASCPTDAFAPSTTVCRAAAGVCDVAESCTGSSGSCPSNAFAADGTDCSDAQVCDGSEMCSSGACLAGAAIDCDDGDVCTADGCAEPSGCMNAAISGCCTSDAECDDASTCTADRCDLSTNRCVADPIPGCCSSDGDCDDGNACTADTCDASTGSCMVAPIGGCCLGDGDCADASACTTDVCDTTTNRCSNDAVSGCCTTDVDCDDGNACTVGSCDTGTGTCSQADVAGCCNFHSECDDGDECTTDTCGSAHGCDHAPIPGCSAVDAGSEPDAGPLATDGGALEDASTAEPDGEPASLDAGSPDAGTATAEGGCSCRAIGTATDTPTRHGLFGLGLLWLLLMRRRRRAGQVRVRLARREPHTDPTA